MDAYTTENQRKIKIAYFGNEKYFPQLESLAARIEVERKPDEDFPLELFVSSAPVTRINYVEVSPVDENLFDVQSNDPDYGLQKIGGLNFMTYSGQEKDRTNFIIKQIP